MAPASSSYVVVFNPTDTPQAVDDEGATVGGGEWAVALRTAERVKTALGADRVVIAERGNNARPDIVRLFEHATDVGNRAAGFAKLDRDELLDIAHKLDDVDLEVRLAVYDTGPTKAELVHALANHPAAQAPKE